MRQPLFIQNTPIDEKRISHIERIVARLTRRSRKHTSAIITPYPISHCAVGEDVKGEILRYMFCAEGQIVKGMLQLNAKPKQGVKVTINVSNETEERERSYIMHKRTVTVEPNIPVSPGDKLIVSITPLIGDEEKKDKVSEIWVSFLWMPHTRDVEIKNFLIEEIENGTLDQVDEPMTELQPSGEVKDA